jgi:hypothetical protein
MSRSSLSYPSLAMRTATRPTRSPLLRRLLVVTLGTLGIAALAACKDDDVIRASREVHTDTLRAYALTGSPLEYPSALNIWTSIAGTTVPINANVTFDVVFDFDPATPNEITVHPVRAILSPVARAHSVAFLKPGETFEDITRAPDGDYRPDSSITVQPREPFVVQSFRSTGELICLYLVTPRVYAKVVVDSVNTTTRAIYLRQTVNPNCGYRSFEPGFPAN